MVVEITESFVLEKTVKRVIAFKIGIDIPNSKIGITSLEGWLKTKTDVILGRLFETHSINVSQHLFTSNVLQPISAARTNHDSELLIPKKYVSEISTELDEKGLEEIELTRKTDPHQATIFKLDLVVTYIRSNIRIPPLQFVSPPADLLQSVENKPPFTPADTGLKIIMSSTRDDYSPQLGYGWIISGNNSPTIFHLVKERIEVDYRIDVGKWVADYLSKLGMGKRILLELPSEGPVFHDVTEYLSEAENALRRWDTKSVFANCREIGTMLDRYIKNIHGDGFIYKYRWSRAYANFNSLASLDLHIEDIKNQYPDQDLRLGKADTEYLLAQTKILTKFAQELVTQSR
jgi:hypothetical protein